MRTCSVLIGDCFLPASKSISVDPPCPGLWQNVSDSGDHVVAGASLYTATTEIFTRLLPRFGVSTSFVDPRKPGAWKEALRSDTRLVYIETPANPTMMITDVREAVAAAKSVRATTLADNTFASPINQRPLELGVDAALHSATKYLGRRGDVEFRAEGRPSCGQTIRRVGQGGDARRQPRRNGNFGATPRFDDPRSLDGVGANDERDQRRARACECRARGDGRPDRGLRSSDSQGLTLALRATGPLRRSVWRPITASRRAGSRALGVPLPSSGAFPRGPRGPWPSSG